jgi:VTC domain
MTENQNQFSSLQQFEAVSLQQLDGVKLMNRVDQKFILHQHELNDLLAEILHSYNVLEIDGKRLFKYSSLYYDTDALNFYTDHHNGKPNRIKIRSREYLDTGTAFFEIKKKIKGFRTEKYRIKKSGDQENDQVLEQALLKHHQLDHIPLVPSILIDYSRITLSAKDLSERVTIDTDLLFKKEQGEESMGGLVIIEVKQDQVKRESPIIQALRKRRNRPFGISKYAMGMVLMNAVNKTNAFRHKVSKIKQLISRNGANRRN